ncbi:hypothetical protein BGZ83_010585 [Gryganskiella cystojenkinii]|nr:hypothetical protein BGZ83_010585 [Gryganskiella cystojenkinii]
MADNKLITASYSTAGSSNPEKTFEQAITLEPSSAAATPSSSKEQYLTALAKSLSTLQESINTGLTDILVQQGVLSSDAVGENAPEKNKIRTKVPGQPNNSKKGQTKKQQQREREQLKEQQQQQQQQQQQETKNNFASSESTTGSESATPMEVEASSDPLDQYKPKGGIYDGDEDEEQDQDKDEVDLVMEADPGEIDGACLELPKDAASTTTASTTGSTAEKRGGVSEENSTTTKKSRADEAA